MLTVVDAAAETLPRSAPEPLRLKQHVIVDREGYGAPIDAIALLLPGDWQVQSRIAWNKVCSGNDLHDILLRAQSPDGRRGFQILPSHAIVKGDYQLAAGSLMPELDAMFRAQIAEQTEQQRQQLAGTNCHPTEPHGATEVVRRYVLPHRPPGTEIVRATPLPEVRQRLLQMLQQTVTPSGIPGDSVSGDADAVVVRLRYNVGGEAFEEDVAASIAGVVTTMVSSVDGSVSRLVYGFTDPIYSVWAPAGEIDRMEPIFAAITTSMHVNPRWARANAQVRDNIARINREGAQRRHEIWMETQREISDMQMQSWQSQQDSQDRAAAQFGEYIRDVESYVDPTTGHPVEMPAFYDNYYADGEGGYVALPAGVDPAELYPDSVWQEMEPAQ